MGKRTVVSSSRARRTLLTACPPRDEFPNSTVRDPSTLVLEAMPRRLPAILPVGVVLLWSAVSCGGISGSASRFDGDWILESEAAPMAMHVRGGGGSVIEGSIVGAVGGRLQPFLEARIINDRLEFRVARTFDAGTTVGSRTVAWFEDGSAERPVARTASTR